jgi:hypothetical protein
MMSPDDTSELRRKTDPMRKTPAEETHASEGIGTPDTVSRLSSLEALVSNRVRIDLGLQPSAAGRTRGAHIIAESEVSQ